ncbi:60Kd inner membrane protein [Novymonas esmeraldas]|uniref:60Kd inner membrane protein n=1 Tax=Novymonas esmeraldas TaxID=1808958 RepID=A0AAW0F2T8_9TRYP
MLRCYRTPLPAGLAASTTVQRCRGSTRASNAHEASAVAAEAPSVGAVAAPLDGASPTYLDYMERLWSSKWFGTVDASTAAAAAAAAASTAHTASADASLAAHVFFCCQQATGLEAGTLLLLAGAATRLATLVASLYGERAGARMRLALPELKKPQEDFNRVYFKDHASAMEVQVAASVLKSHRRAVFRKYGTSNLRCVASLGMAPVVMTGLFHASALCENAALGVGASSYLWCGALAFPDPLLLLPMATCAITLLNFELSLASEVKTGWMRNVVWGARLGCLCVVPVVSSFRAGVCLYLVGMNMAGLLQPLLLRSVAVRRRLRFPSAEELAAAAAAPPPPRRSAPTPSAAAGDRVAQWRERIAAAVAPAAAGGSVSASASAKSGDVAENDVLQASMSVQFPYLSHLLNPQVDEHQDLFAKAPSKQSKPDFSRRAAPAAAAATATSGAARSASSTHGSRYARGTNPLMPEVPLHHHRAPRPSTSHAGTHEGGGGDGHHTSSEEVATAARRVPRSKGSTFASSGWRSSQLSFEEDDFIPAYADSRATHSPPMPPRPK